MSNLALRKKWKLNKMKLMKLKIWNLKNSKKNLLRKDSSKDLLHTTNHLLTLLLDCVFHAFKDVFSPFSVFLLQDSCLLLWTLIWKLWEKNVMNGDFICFLLPLFHFVLVSPKSFLLVLLERISLRTLEMLFILLYLRKTLDGLILEIMPQAS